VESGSNTGQAQQLRLRKEKKGYVSNTALMALFPSGQPANPTSEAATFCKTLHGGESDCQRAYS